MYFFGTLALIAVAFVIYGWVQDIKERKGIFKRRA